MAQSTSVPGVAQRTGATIYYVEMLPPKDGRAPILSLMPAPGDVDVVLAAELMEAGRSILRGLVTPDRTTLIASTHRSFAVAEKEKPGDGIGDPKWWWRRPDFAAKRVIAFDMEALATKNSSVISACLFGALAASGRAAVRHAKPSRRRSAPAARASNPASKLSGAAFDRRRSKPRAQRRRSSRPQAPRPAAGIRRPSGPRRSAGAHPRGISAEALHPILYAGVKKLTDFQDPAYAGDYLDRVAALHALDQANDGAAKGLRVHACSRQICRGRHGL